MNQEPPENLPRRATTAVMSRGAIGAVKVDVRSTVLISSAIIAAWFRSLSIPMAGEKIVINATPEVVFDVLRALRNTADKQRQLESFDGKVAIIKEELEGVPVLGKVSCVWQEVEQPFTRIDFKMLSSSKFKASHGSFILTPGDNGTTTTLELDVFLDSGLTIPFAAEITKKSTASDSRHRLEKVKKMAEETQRQAKA